MNDSLCPDRAGDCAPHEHMHCSVPRCRAILYAVGGAGDDGRRIAGYEDEHGNDARVCTQCGDEFFLLCSACASEDSRCGACRSERAA